MHKGLLLLLLAAFAGVKVTQAQIGAAVIGNAAPGHATVGTFNGIGKTALPVCGPKSMSCTAVPYVFTGNGYWDLAENWLNDAVPPPVVPAGETIVIRPTEGGECILNVFQTFAAGTVLTILPGKRLRVLKVLLFLQ